MIYLFAPGPRELTRRYFTSVLGAASPKWLADVIYSSCELLRFSDELPLPGYATIARLKHPHRNNRLTTSSSSFLNSHTCMQKLTLGSCKKATLYCSMSTQLNYTKLQVITLGVSLTSSLYSNLSRTA